MTQILGTDTARAAFVRAVDARSSIVAALAENEHRVDALHGERMRLLALAALTTEQVVELGGALGESGSSVSDSSESGSSASGSSVSDSSVSGSPVSGSRPIPASGAAPASAPISESGAETRRRELQRRSLVAEIATALHFSEVTVSGLIDDAETLANSLPQTFTALRSGTISLRHARTLAGNARSLPSPAHPEFEAAALPDAAALTAAQFTQRVRVLRESMHPESIEVRHRAAAEERGVWLDPERDGMAALHCLLPAVEALAIDDVLDQIARSLREGDGASDTIGTAGIEHPTTNGAPTNDDTASEPECDAEAAAAAARQPSPKRTHAQRRADALVDLLLGREGRAAALARTVAPNLLVTVPVLTLLGHVDEPGELHGYGPIPPSTARRLAAHAPSFLRILTHPDTGETISVGRERYRPPADLRLALIAEDETCRFPGCRRRAARCELDHTTDWACGGATSRENLAHLCPKHHHLKHDTAWSVRSGPARSLTWTSPTGREHTTRPMGRRTPTRAPSPPGTRRVPGPSFEPPP